MYPKQIDFATVDKINQKVDIQTFNKMMNATGQLIEELRDKGFDQQEVITYIWYTLYFKYQTKEPRKCANCGTPISSDDDYCKGNCYIKDNLIDID